MDGIGLLALDGANTIGGSKLLLKYDDRQVLLDFGTSFRKFGTYYEEFLRPRSAGGLLDYVVMGVLPNVRNLYRDDLIHPELSLDGQDVGRIDAMLLSHAHADHFGDMGFLRLDVPVVTNALSAAIVKAMADCGKTDIGKDHICPNPKYRSTFRGTEIIQSCSAAEARELGIRGRDFVLSGGAASTTFEEFWAMSPAIVLADSPKRCKPHLPGTLRTTLESVKFKSFPVDHSVKGATAYVIPTSRGNVVYTGDLRMHGINGRLTEDFVQAAKSPRPHVLIIEGTRAGRTTDSSLDSQSATEEDVLENTRKLLSDMTGRFVIADFGPRNIERLEIFLKAATENHRKMVVTTKDAYLLHAMNSVDRTVPVPGSDLLIYDGPKGSESKYEEYILDRIYPGATVCGADVKKSPGDYLMAFSFFDLKHLVDIRPKTGHYMYSSCEAFSEEQEIDFLRMGAWLHRFDLTPHGLSFEKGGSDQKVRPVFPKGSESLHASGHATKEDLVKIVDTIDPEIVIPVHTEDQGWFTKTFGGQRTIINPEEGKWLAF